MTTTIKNPIEWSAGRLAQATAHAGDVSAAVRGQRRPVRVEVHPLGLSDLRAAASRGLEDTLAYRTDVMFLCLFYPVIGMALTWAAFDFSLLPLVFPAASGFALVGPAAAVGLYELSRRREQGQPADWSRMFSVIASPSFGAVVVLALGLLVLFSVWIASAQAIHAATLGPEPPASLAAFASAVASTPEGWTMIGVGMAVGFLFAALVLTISLISFPMLLDRDVGLRVAVLTSVDVARRNPVAVAAWGFGVALALMLASLPLFLGLIVVIPMLGHATWHLYRRAVTVSED